MTLRTVSAYLVILAGILVGCTDGRNSVFIGGIVCIPPFEPFDGRGVRFEGIRQATTRLGGEEWLVWEGRYESPPHPCKAPTVAHLVLAMRQADVADRDVRDVTEEILVHGMLLGSSQPTARIQMDAMSFSMSQSWASGICDVELEEVWLTVAPMGSAMAWQWLGDDHRLVRKYKERGRPIWSGGSARILIPMQTEASESVDVSQILWTYGLELAPNGQFKVLAEGEPPDV